MPNNGGVITAPISINADIATVLGSSSYDLGTLCKSNAIKMWALYKPVKHTKIGELIGTETRGYNGQCGMVLPYCKGSSLAAMAKNLWQNNSSLAWSYEKPSGGGYPYRALDFNGYDHNSVTPFINKLPTSLFPTDAGSNSVVTLGFSKSAYNRTRNFTPDVMAIEGSECEDWYPGILVLNSSGIIEGLVTTRETMYDYKGNIGTAYDYVNIAPSALKSGLDYTKFFIMCSKNYYGSNAYYRANGSNAIDSNAYYAFFPTLPNTLNLVSPAQLFIHAKVSVSASSINLNLYSTNLLDYNIEYPIIDVSLEYWIDQEDGGSWGTIKTWDNYELERSIMLANTSNLLLADDYISYSKSSGWVSNAPTYRIVIHGVYPDILGDDTTEFRDVNGSVWG